MSINEILIMESAVRNALCFGIGIMTACREAIEGEGLEWTDRHEKFAFDQYASKQYEKDWADNFLKENRA